MENYIIWQFPAFLSPGQIKSLILQPVSTYVILNRSKYPSSFSLSLKTKTKQSLQRLAFSFSCAGKLEQIDAKLCFPEVEFTDVRALCLF